MFFYYYQISYEFKTKFLWLQEKEIIVLYTIDIPFPLLDGPYFPVFRQNWKENDIPINFLTWVYSQ